jgi:hypothetical protein
MQNDDDVGFGKPPRHTQFKPGQSGNPAGRPKGTKNLKTDLEEELRELITVREGGNQKIVSKQRSMLKSLTAKAVQGDPRAAAIIIDMMYRLLHEDDAEDTSRVLSPDDKAILKAFENRLLRESDEAPEDSNASDAAINSVKGTPNENDE